MKNNDQVQSLTSLPNANEKCIDYVIFYEKAPETETKLIRKRNEFFMQLSAELFEVHFLEFDFDNKKYVYALLHCPIERLMEEGETMRLEMRLRNVVFYF